MFDTILLDKVKSDVLYLSCLASQWLTGIRALPSQLCSHSTHGGNRVNMPIVVHNWWHRTPSIQRFFPFEKEREPISCLQSQSHVFCACFSLSSRTNQGPHVTCLISPPPPPITTQRDSHTKRRHAEKTAARVNSSPWRSTMRQSDSPFLLRAPLLLPLPLSRIGPYVYWSSCHSFPSCHSFLSLLLAPSALMPAQSPKLLHVIPDGSGSSLPRATPASNYISLCGNRMAARQPSGISWPSLIPIVRITDAI